MAIKYDAFCVCIRTDNMVANGENYSYVAAHGTKKDMKRWFDYLTAMPETITCELARYSKAGVRVGETVKEYRR